MGLNSSGRLFSRTILVFSALQTINGIGHDKFKFELFENFDATKKLFQDEIQFVKELKDFQSKLQEAKEDILQVIDLQKNSSFLRNFRYFPNFQQLIGAKKGFVYLQDTYKFKSKPLLQGVLVPSGSEGLLLQMKANVKFDRLDYYYFCKLAFKYKWYDTAILFLRNALQPKANQELPPKIRDHMTKMKKDLVLLNNQLLYKHKKVVGKDFKILPYTISDKLKRLKEQPDFVRSGNWYQDDFKSIMGQETNFKSVCANEKRAAQNLKCHFLHRHNPYLRLGPIKLESMSENPMIVVFHELLEEAEIRFLVDYAKPRLTESRKPDFYSENIVQNKTQNVTRLIQKSTQCFIKDIEYDNYVDNLHEIEPQVSQYEIKFPNLVRLSRRLELVSGLNLTSKYASTDFQVTNYGLGGLCETHYDPHGYIEGVKLPPYDEFARFHKFGDMFATFMGWLNQVGGGGATAFSGPGYETMVSPTKGSVAFWFGLDKKGFRDPRLLHGGCPVIRGSKWIMNKWVYYYDQFANHPCEINSNSYVKYLKSAFL